MNARCSLACAHMAPAAILWAASTAPVTKDLPWIPEKGTAQVGATPHLVRTGHACRKLWEGVPVLNVKTSFILQTPFNMPSYGCGLKQLTTLSVLQGSLQSMEGQPRPPLKGNSLPFFCVHLRHFSFLDSAQFLGALGQLSSLQRPSSICPII